MKLFILDNYDSFTYNIVQALRRLGQEPGVARNDRVELDEIAAYDKIIISPGPGIPSEAGILPQLLERYAGEKPILGICLGHQAIGEHFGARLENLAEVFHGVSAQARVTAPDYILNGMGEEFTVGRYHSWVVSDEELPKCLIVTSRSPEGQIMSLRHRTMDIHGVQFHPESILTPGGERILANFINY
ncbi:MAG: aminodeoxychorismate/anthranilate synthase component II [Pseudoflavonifractor sp.]|nr:aminodeoxychorismate/anthranilate synthase component II [Alloprevotella sp.]MCM1116513.1 aminodeoxychorismate/anthranilate synthase component II [Pseudoflavonifractor sp.]